jgi:anti-sigma-K factor RskA
MPPDATPELGHPEAAGWVLGALDPEETKRFEQHLRSCGECQTAVAEFEPVARALQHPAPAAEPPPDLQARTLASVQRAAAMGAKRPASTRARLAIWRRWNIRMLSLATTAAAAAAAVIAFVLLQAAQSAPAEAYTIPLHAPSGGTASGQAIVHQTANGWSIQLTAHRLANLGPRQFYECWYAGPGNSPGHPDLISAGTFTVGRNGSATVQMWTAANPDTFPTMQITAEHAGDAAQLGEVILTGTARG